MHFTAVASATDRFTPPSFDSFTNRRLAYLLGAAERSTMPGRLLIITAAELELGVIG